MNRLPDKQVAGELKRWESNFQTTSDEKLIVERTVKVLFSFFLLPWNNMAAGAAAAKSDQKTSAEQRHRNLSLWTHTRGNKLPYWRDHSYKKMFKTFTLSFSQRAWSFLDSENILCYSQTSLTTAYHSPSHLAQETSQDYILGWKRIISLIDAMWAQWLRV